MAISYYKSHRPSKELRQAGVPDLCSCNGNRPGVTLVELLVVTVLIVLVCGVALTLYQLTVRHSVQQQAIQDQTQNLRAALYTVARDVRMAGNGLNFMGNQMVQIFIPVGLTDNDIQKDSGWFRYKGADAHGVRAVFGQNGGATGPDSLTIFRTEVESTIAIGSLQSDYHPGTDNSIFLRDASTAVGLLNAGDMLAITWVGTSVIVQAESFNAGTGEIIIGQRYRPGEPLPGGVIVPEGAQIHNLRDVTFVTYHVDTAENRLMASYMDGSIDSDDYDNTADHSIIVANDIEDFQVAYYLNGTAVPINGILEGNLSGNWVRGVTVSLVTRSSRNMNVSGGGGPLQVMDHTTVGAEDGFVRRIMTEDINLRNF